MNSRLMREFEEFEGLSGLAVDDTVMDDKDDDDPSFRPAQASLLTSNEIYYEVRKFNNILVIFLYILYSLKKED
jgi:hypothetical protein